MIAHPDAKDAMNLAQRSVYYPLNDDPKQSRSLNAEEDKRLRGTYIVIFIIGKISTMYL